MAHLALKTNNLQWMFFFDNSFHQNGYFEITYKLEFRKSVYNLVGRIHKAEKVAYKNRQKTEENRITSKVK